MLELNLEKTPTKREIADVISEIRNDNIKTYIFITIIIVGMLLGSILAVTLDNLSTSNRLFDVVFKGYSIILTWVVGFSTIRYLVRSIRDESIYKDEASYELHQEVNSIRDNNIKSYIDMVAKENRKLTTFEALSLINIATENNRNREIDTIYEMGH